MDLDPIRPPYLTGDLPGIGGRIKAEPEHFVVRELPLYEPTGTGEHVYLTLTRKNANTADLTRDLARLLDLRPGAIGTAGRKDRQALVTQTFSLHLPGDTRPADTIAARVQDELPVTVESAARHGNKLRMGHLAGNAFEILVTDMEPDVDPVTRARPVIDELRRRGLPNYFGPQRFGKDGTNPERGREVLLGRSRPRDRSLADLFISAYQSALFNRWLAARILAGNFERMLAGDVAQRSDSGAPFDVTDPDGETERLLRGEITYTGPLFGKKMRPATGEAGAREAELLEAQGIQPADFKKATGARRPGRLHLPEITLEPTPNGLWFRFQLPRGAYATALLREILKNDAPEVRD